MLAHLPLDIWVEILELLSEYEVCRLWMTNGSVKRQLEWAPLKLKLRGKSWNLKSQRWLSHFMNPRSISFKPQEYWLYREESDKWTVEFAGSLSRRLESLEYFASLSWAVVPLFPSSLTSLLIENTWVRDYKHLSDLPNTLRVLGISFIRITPQIAQSLPNSLEVLRIGYTNQKTIKGSYSHLPPHLTSLQSRYSGRLGSFEDEKLPSSLTELKLRGNAKITDKAVKELPRNITSLDVEGHVITGATLSHLDQLLSFGIESYSWVRSFALPPSLTQLNVRYPDLTPSVISEMPPKLKYLECFGENKSLLGSLHRLPSSIEYVTINGKRIKMKLKKKS